MPRDRPLFPLITLAFQSGTLCVAPPFIHTHLLKRTCSPNLPLIYLNITMDDFIFLYLAFFLIIYIFHPPLLFPLLLFFVFLIFCYNLKLRNHSRELIRITVACAAAVAVARSETITPLRIPSMPSLSIPFSVTLTTLHTIGTTSHRLFSLGHDGWPFEQFSFSKGSTYTQFFLSLFLFLSCFIYIYFL